MGKLYLRSATLALFICYVEQVSFAQNQALNCNSSKAFFKGELL